MGHPSKLDEALEASPRQQSEAVRQQDDAARDRSAAEAYKNSAEAIFNVPCCVETETIEGETVHVVKIPVEPGIERPHRAYADKERLVHMGVEARCPELSGRVIIRYERRADAA